MGNVETSDKLLEMSVSLGKARTVCGELLNNYFENEKPDITFEYHYKTIADLLFIVDDYLNNTAKQLESLQETARKEVIKVG